MTATIRNFKFIDPAIEALIQKIGLQFNILSVFVERGYHKRIKKWDEDLITFEEIITFLYALKIKFPEKLNKDEIKNKLFLFNRSDFVDYKNVLSQILGKLENESKN